MKSIINTIIENMEKLKSKSKPKPSIPLIPIIPKNASFSKTIPFDIISNNICPFLKMISITNLAKCDRKLAVICHTPTSIKNLMHRNDIYPYIIQSTQSNLLFDGKFYNMNNWTVSNIHRFENVESLSIAVNMFDNIQIFNSFRNVKHLSIYDVQWMTMANYDYSNMKLLPLLETISFSNFVEPCVLLSFLEQYKLNSIDSPKQYYNNIIYGLKSIAFVDSDLSDLPGYNPEYQNMLYFLLQSQPNHLEILKFENSYCMKSDNHECKIANDEFENIEKIKTSLAHLKGFIYGQSSYIYDNNKNIFYILATNILSNLISFPKLKSLHTHSDSSTLIQLYLNNNNINALNKITELCVSISMNEINSSCPLYKLNVLVPNLNKLCLVVNVSENDKKHVFSFYKLIYFILKQQIKLKLFQIVFVMKSKCWTIINILNKFNQNLIKVLNNILSIYTYSNKQEKQPLVFKYHIKSCHDDINDSQCKDYKVSELASFAVNVQSLIVNYLITYPLGKIQFKFSWNTVTHMVLQRKLKSPVQGLKGLFRVSISEKGTLEYLSENASYSDINFKQYAVSATKNNINNIDHVKKWDVDCRYCCNTPWV